jgi:hypothetical protein
VIVILDSGVLHTLISTSKVKEVTDCQDWFYYLLSRSALVVTSAICNYEVKREMGLHWSRKLGNVTVR